MDTSDVLRHVLSHVPSSYLVYTCPDFHIPSLTHSLTQLTPSFELHVHHTTLPPAHPPIHPTRSVSLASLTDPQERQLYELVTRHFLACCAPDATGQQTTLRVQMSRRAKAVLEEGRGERKGGSPMEVDSADDDDEMDQEHTRSRGGAEEGEEEAWLMDGEVFKATGLMVEERNW